MKKLAKSALVQRLLVGFAFAYIRFVWWTSRAERDWHPEADALLKAGRPFIAAFWHSRILLMAYHWPQTGALVHVLISQHRDGAMIARAVRPFGIEAIAGSSRRGGKEALYEIVRLLEAGKIVAITPDGPKGPRQRAKFGVAYAAITAGVPVIPITYSVKRRRLMGSWDRFVLALPFNRVLLRADAPISVTGLSIEAARERIEAAMNAQLAAVDAHFGFPPVPPGPPLDIDPRPDMPPSPEMASGA
jgi:lysophospholipid acyltransferase (LPLAT)-like uncharacterized protein